MIDLAPNIVERLRPHQPALARALLGILRAHKTGVDLSQTGTGKTYVSAAVASSLREPTLVVCPKVAQSAWTRAAEHFGDKFSVINYEMLRTGRTDFGKWSNGNPESKIYFRCQCCQQIVDFDKFTPCFAHPRGIHCVETKKRAPVYGKFSFHKAVRNIIFDEVHRCGSTDSLNADMLIAAKRDGHRVTGLSATPACSPIGMRGLGYLLDLHNLDTDKLAMGQIGMRVVKPCFERWSRHYGVRYDRQFHGLKWFMSEEDQRRIMLEIRGAIIPERGVRITVDEIPGFPKRDIQAELYDVENPEKIDAVYAEMRTAIDMLRDRAACDKAPEHPLTKILRARQEVELLKVPLFEELGHDYLAKGLSVVFFVNFRQTIDELFKRFPDARIIDGQTGARDESVDLFQRNLCRVLIVNNEAGGLALSLQDLTGLFPRIGLVSPCYSAVTLQQVFGRLHRDGGLTQCFYRVLFANSKVERRMHRLVQPKLNNIDALTDGDLNPENLILCD